LYKALVTALKIQKRIVLFFLTVLPDAYDYNIQKLML